MHSTGHDMSENRTEEPHAEGTGACKQTPNPPHCSLKSLDSCVAAAAAAAAFCHVCFPRGCLDVLFACGGASPGAGEWLQRCVGACG